MNLLRRCIIISGPTASGKTSLALQLAEKLSGEIINGDSVQIYRHFDIGSAKATPEEQKKVPHHLIDVCGPNDRMDAAQFYDRCTQHIDEIISRGNIPFIVGSSGMYLATLLNGLSNLPPTDLELRHSLENLPSQELWNRLNEVDPTRAEELDVGDRARAIRAIEIAEKGSTSYHELIKEDNLTRSRQGVRSNIFVLLSPRQDLYQKINERTQHMFAVGLEEEVHRLVSLYPKDHIAFRAIGYREVREGILNGTDPKELFELVARETRRYAKRQLTFWRNEPLKRGWQMTPSEPFVKVGKEYEVNPRECSLEDMCREIQNFMKTSAPETQVCYCSARHGY